MPIVFYIYGKKIRGKSKFAPAPDIEQDKRRDEEARGDGGESEGTSGSGDVNGSNNSEKVKERTE